MSAAALARPRLDLTPFQQHVLLYPDDCDLMLGGGRGGGKSFTMALLYLRHAETHGALARMLFVRRNFSGMQDFEATCRIVFGMAYGTAATYNASSHLWRFPSGATLQLDQYETDTDFAKYQGKSFTLIGVDEAGQYPTPAMLDLLRSCLRAPLPIVPRFIMSANPGGPGHGWLCRRHMFKAAPWVPYVEETTGRTFVNCPSTFEDNPNLDQTAYARQLDAATATDPELGRAWKLGDWTVARGAYFSAVLDERRVMIEPWAPGRLPSGWAAPFLAHDYGVSAPSVTYVTACSPGARGPDGRFYPRNSILLLDELATNEPGSIERGMGYTVPVLAERIKDLAAAWKIHPDGIADDAIFGRTGGEAGTIAAEFRAHGVSFSSAKKGLRVSGWEKMRLLLLQAGMPDTPGLYVSRRCEYWWQTVPSLARDPRKSDDVDSRGPDHGADACRYACTYEPAVMIFTPGRVIY
jgi:hypothetical protein